MRLEKFAVDMSAMQEGVEVGLESFDDFVVRLKSLRCRASRELSRRQVKEGGPVILSAIDGWEPPEMQILEMLVHVNLTGWGDLERSDGNGGFETVKYSQEEAFLILSQLENRPLLDAIWLKLLDDENFRQGARAEAVKN